MLGIIRKIVKFSVKWYPTCYDYGLHRGAVPWNVGQGQNWKAAKWPMFGKSLFFLCWWVSQCLWLLCILTWTLTWIQTNMCTSKQSTNKQSNRHTNMYGHLKRGLKPLISQNVHHINHKKDIIKWSGRGLICMDSVFMLIVTGIFDFINVYWFQWHDQGSVLGGRPKCLHHRLAPHPHAVDELTRALRTKYITPHKRTCSLLTLHDHWHSFCNFQLRPCPIFWTTALSPIA